MEITKEAFKEAKAAGEARGPRVVSARYRRSSEKLEIEFANGVTLAVPVRLIQGLDGACAADLSKIEITPLGTGLHWPRLDVDVYARALFEGVYGSQNWMRDAARRAGSSTSEAKAAAARENGRKGGRPRKAAA
ncbi:DUF2442 domain-containing protein [Paraburkholderia sp. GAS334]|uniref:DUF2442 domain-containing protein n=1 Tax=Paraburkholderia sp. GAS334 TaxID=3035131 RepID=UPI003D1F6CA6